MKFKTNEIILISFFSALTAIGAFLSIPIGEIPISMQTIFVLLSGIILGAKLGALSQIIYIIIGLFGFRVFAGFKGGIQMFFSPTFGFLIGFIFSSYFIGYFANKKINFNFINLFILAILANLVVYIFGLPYMYFILNKIMNVHISLIQTIKTGFLVFIPGDILKSILVSYIAIAFKKRNLLSKTS